MPANEQWSANLEIALVPPPPVEAAGMNVGAWSIGQELGVCADTIRRFCERNDIKLATQRPGPRHDSQRAARAALKGLFGKQKRLSDSDRAEMNRLRDEAIAAGRVTRCPPGYAFGAKTFYREEYSA